MPCVFHIELKKILKTQKEFKRVYFSLKTKLFNDYSDEFMKENKFLIENKVTELKNIKSDHLFLISSQIKNFLFYLKVLFFSEQKKFNFNDLVKYMEYCGIFYHENYFNDLYYYYSQIKNQEINDILQLNYILNIFKKITKNKQNLEVYKISDGKCENFTYYDINCEKNLKENKKNIFLVFQIEIDNYFESLNLNNDNIIIITKNSHNQILSFENINSVSSYVHQYWKFIEDVFNFCNGNFILSFPSLGVIKCIIDFYKDKLHIILKQKNLFIQTGSLSTDYIIFEQFKKKNILGNVYFCSHSFLFMFNLPKINKFCLGVPYFYKDSEKEINENLIQKFIGNNFIFVDSKFLDEKPKKIIENFAQKKIDYNKINVSSIFAFDKLIN